MTCPWVIDGWRLEVSELRSDVIKMEHIAVKPEVPGLRVWLDWSPYQYLTERAFELFVRLDFPSRSAVGSKAPLNEDDLERLWASRLEKENTNVRT